MMKLGCRGGEDESILLAMAGAGAGGSSGREEKLARVTTLGDAAARITVLIPFSHNDAQSALL